MAVAQIENFAKSFEDLQVFQRAYAVSLEIHKASKEFPADERYALTSQIRRASKSICANIAEGFVKQGQSSAEFARFLSIAIGSAGEMQVWLKYCLDLDYISQETHKAWRAEYQSTLKMLQKLRSSQQANSNH